MLDDQVLYIPVTATTSYNPLCKCVSSILKVAYLSQFSFVLTASGHLLIVLIFSSKSAAVFPFLGNCLSSWAALNPHRISCDCGKQPSPASQSLIYQADCTRPTFDSPLGEVTAPLSIPVHHFSLFFFFHMDDQDCRVTALKEHWKSNCLSFWKFLECTVVQHLLMLPEICKLLKKNMQVVGNRCMACCWDWR